MPQRNFEQDISYKVLYVLDKYGTLTTSQLIDFVRSEFAFDEGDLDPLLNRPRDVKINQIIRNIVSHRTSSNNLINKGWLNYNSSTGSISITQLGRLEFKKYL